MYFTDLNLSSPVLDGLEAMNFFEATPIQEAAIPALLQGRDLLGCAQTGSGKTAAYLLPIIDKISKGTLPEEAIHAVVMAPTRELAVQIDRQVEGFSYFVSMSTLAVYGGTDGITWEQQKRAMEMGADIVIATPGRLLSMINLQATDLSQVSYFVLDEADRMLDMGFYNDILAIYKELPARCQVLMFSATMPEKIKTLAQAILKNPVQIELSVAKPPESIMQTAYFCYDRQKLPLVLSLLESQMGLEDNKRVIVFSSSKQTVKDLTKELVRKKLPAAAIHSDLEQEQREQVLKDFRAGRIPLLIATDVVARGIDIDDIGVVINYELPRDHEDYVHRIGRTARGTDGEGLAITLINPKERKGLEELKEFLGQDILWLPLDEELLGAAPTEEDARTYTNKKRNPKNKAKRGGRSQKKYNRRKGSGKAKDKRK